MVPKEKTLNLKWLKIKIKKDLVDHKKKIRWDDEMVDKLIDLYEDQKTRRPDLAFGTLLIQHTLKQT